MFISLDNTLLPRIRSETSLAKLICDSSEHVITLLGRPFNCIYVKQHCGDRKCSMLERMMSKGKQHCDSDTFMVIE